MRTDPPDSGPELAALTGFLDYQRETMLMKADGLSREQLAQPLSPSPTRSAGCSTTWPGSRTPGSGAASPACRRRSGGPAPTRPSTPTGSSAPPPTSIPTSCASGTGRPAPTAAQAASLDQLSARPRRDGAHVDVRWILIHMVEETARHVRHADPLRESIDGAVGE